MIEYGSKDGEIVTDKWRGSISLKKEVLKLNK
jgi:hypothetical protein